MAGDEPDFLYRGTTLSRLEEGSRGNSSFPPNWTDDPLQGASYALGHVFGNTYDNIPVVLVTGFEEDFFEEDGGTRNYFPGIPVEDGGEVNWHKHAADDRFGTEEQRDEALKVFDQDNLEDFVDTHLSEASRKQREAVETLFEQYTFLERYREVSGGGA